MSYVELKQFIKETLTHLAEESLPLLDVTISMTIAAISEQLIGAFMTERLAMYAPLAANNRSDRKETLGGHSGYGARYSVAVDHIGELRSSINAKTDNAIDSLLREVFYTNRGP